MMCAELEQLRTELADRAYELDCRGQASAADLAAEIAARLAQLIATHANADAKARTAYQAQGRDRLRPVRRTLALRFPDRTTRRSSLP